MFVAVFAGCSCSVCVALAVCGRERQHLLIMQTAGKWKQELLSILKW